jgi:hypothetical protein
MSAVHHGRDWMIHVVVLDEGHHLTRDRGGHHRRSHHEVIAVTTLSCVGYRTDACACQGVFLRVASARWIQ